MTQKVVLIHTVSSLVEPFDVLFREILPSVQTIHIADEILLTQILEEKGLSPAICQRVKEHVIAAEMIGVSVVLCTCSSISPCVAAVQPLVNIPVIKVDEAMVDQAIELGAVIGIMATAPVTLRPTMDLVWERAGLASKEVKVEPVLCEGAYDALLAGELSTHDNIVVGYLRELMTRVDVVLLAQASMARVLQALPPDERRVPVLSSPRLAVERVRDVLAQIDA